MQTNQDFVILISANAEWQVVKNLFPECKIIPSVLGEWFSYFYRPYPELVKPVIFMHGGWGKVSAAASTQFSIDRWHPRLVVNLGTCGGFEGHIQRGEIILADKTIIYDIYEQMGDPDEHIQHYTVDLDTAWLREPFPQPVIRTLLVSGDRDLFWNDIPGLHSKYGAIAGDWESGAIGWVAAHNHTQCLILRGVSDLVGAAGGDAYQGKINKYYENTELIMRGLIKSLPQWLIRYYQVNAG
jgi:adenosylhomocysteine nucleosidase